MEKFCCVVVRNKSLSVSDFDSLCDYLSEYRQLASDYRMVSDFNELKEQKYWHSPSYYTSDKILTSAAFDSIWEDVYKFLSKIHLPFGVVKIDIQYYD